MQKNKINNKPEVKILKAITIVISAILVVISLIHLIFVVFMEKKIYFFQTFTKGILLVGVGLIAILLSVLNGKYTVGKRERSDKYILLIGIFLVITGIAVLFISAS